jgi:hypothetical protein
MGTKKNNYNRNARQKFINYLIKEKRKNINKGLIDYQDEFGQFTNVTDFDPLSSYINQVQTVQDLVDKGFYKKDGAFAKGEKIPSYNISPDMPGLMSIMQDTMSGPITREKLMEYYNNINTLENLDPTDPNNSIKNLMETYQPHRYNLQYGDNNMNGGGGGGQEYIPYLPPEEDAEEETFDYRFGTGQKVGRDVTLGYAANGGRITRAGGGIMNAVPRQGYFLGGIGKAIKGVVGGVADAAGKVLKSPIGQAALLYAGGTYLGGMKAFGGTGKASFLSRLKSPSNLANLFKVKDWSQGNLLNPLLRSYDDKLGKYTGLSPLKGIMNLSALPFAMQALGIGQPKQDPSLMASRKDTGLIDPLTGEEGTPASMRANIELAKIEAAGDPIKLAALNQKYNNMLFTTKPYENYGLYANGGRIARAEGGLMNLGGMEKDYRAEGGFVPIGKARKSRRCTCKTKCK